MAAKVNHLREEKQIEELKYDKIAQFRVWTWIVKISLILSKTTGLSSTFLRKIIKLENRQKIIFLISLSSSLFLSFDNFIAAFIH